MKLEIARGVFLLGSVAIVALAMTAWEQPGPLILGAPHGGAHCPLPRVAKTSVAVEPDHDLLLLLFGLTRGIRPNS